MNSNLRKKRKEREEQKHIIYKKKLLNKIIKGDNPILKEVCKPINSHADLSQGYSGNNGNIIVFLKRIISATDNGLGLAAPQIGIPKRAFIIRPNLKKKEEMFICINPEIIEYSELKTVMMEGCLSFPDVFTEIERYQEIKVRYLNAKLEICEHWLVDFEARIFQHELDHLNGFCLIAKTKEK